MAARAGATAGPIPFPFCDAATRECGIGAPFRPLDAPPGLIQDSIVGDIPLAGETMDEEISAMRGILLGVLTGATLWLMIYAATFL